MRFIKYILIFTILLVSAITQSVYADQAYQPNIMSVSAGNSPTGYINNTGDIVSVFGISEPSSTITATLTDKDGNSVSNEQFISIDSHGYRINIYTNLAEPNRLVDGPITLSVSAVSISSTTPSTPVIMNLIKQTIPPKITIIGDNPFYCQTYEICPDLGAIAVDSLGERLQVNISSNVITSRANDGYLITYRATDNAGNSSVLGRRVSVSNRTTNLSSTTITFPESIFEEKEIVSNTSVPTTTNVEEVSSPTADSEEVSTVPVTVIMVSGVADTMKRQLYRGISGEDVRLLQILLAKDISIYPEGLVTSYFGPLTETAVQRFQEKNGVASIGVAGYGQVGPKTKAKLIELFGM